MNIANNGVRLQDTAAFADALTVNKSLSTLIFGDGGKDEDGEVQLAMLQSGMTDADLSGKSLGCACMAIAVAFLPRCDGLISLDISSNKIGW